MKESFNIRGKRTKYTYLPAVFIVSTYLKILVDGIRYTEYINNCQEGAKRKEQTMATTKYNFTNAQYASIIHAAVNAGKAVDDGIIADIMGYKYDTTKHSMEEFARKESHMFHVATAKTTKQGVSIKDEENTRLATEFMNKIGFGTIFYLDDMKDFLGGVNSASKAAAVVNKLRTIAKVENAESDRKGKKAYIIVE